ncbi:universal stress protein [Caulobacter segnis]|jgi:nucleotide-binding universal stress UspA family protein|uniref:universal stress protein n=1 Tax=Caulobacter segnis TaxID=88688 RepID=UPI001CBEEC7B|nr:universal stress protein [Caulobacter segnis]UAL08691.1 universal stress protein [Caulobacter segnis]
MGLNDILLNIDTYPDATPPEAIEDAVRFVKLVGGRVSALAVGVRFPVQSNRIADYLIGLGSMAAEEQAKSLANGQASLEAFAKHARAAGVFGQALSETVEYYAVADHVAKCARTRDLCLTPLGKPMDGQAEVVTSAVFDSGRPVLAYRAGGLSGAKLGTVVIAWDGSRGAARALAEALPILAHAERVRVLTVVNEKPAAVAGLAAEAVRHLRAHGIEAVIDEVDGIGVSIGDSFDAYLARTPCDLFVMGAYGRSRAREFILGGATEHMLHDPQVPLLLAH